MILFYIIIAVFTGIIAGCGYYNVTRSKLKCNYEMQNLIMMLRNTKRNAFFIGAFFGIIWPLVIVVFASFLIASLIFILMSPEAFNKPFDVVKEPKDVDLTNNNESLDLTNHNIVLDEHNETNTENDDTMWRLI